MESLCAGFDELNAHIANIDISVQTGYDKLNKVVESNTLVAAPFTSLQTSFENQAAAMKSLCADFAELNVHIANIDISVQTGYDKLNKVVESNSRVASPITSLQTSFGNQGKSVES